ncbi:MAG: DUF983 domain-containing protein [Alphaproteobacteria bacterium]|nr:DUF983 domain-containing protein [Alphaproteobacteria bacterium]HIB55789.1 DUF983 domain-containing protein [Alphaproteobacteria bacterium]HIO02184.1 DUF983 domain-containing protein [Alphaproteobacteria bacterium]
MVKPRSSSVSLFRSGLGCKCPRCGRGHLFSGYLIVADKCDLCGLNFQGQDAGDGPAVFIILILGFFVVGMAVLFEVVVAPPMWLHVLLWFPVTIGGSIWLLRPFKAVMIVLQYKHGLLGSSRDNELP